VHTADMYRGVLPYIGLQVLLMLMLALFPAIATWLPSVVYP
jgi:TRAP-type mannitol/chloroaromatic compound transport system permease large subunit